MTTLSAVVIVRDEEAMIEGCLSRLGFADEILVLVDDRTTDASAQIARAADARVLERPFTTFASFRETAMAEATSDWILFVDADERVTAELATEIAGAVADGPAAYRVPIQNWFYGHHVRRTGYRERPIRLFPRTMRAYSGDIHEAPEVPSDMQVQTLRNPLVHMSHRSISDNLTKTRAYADIQATEMSRCGHRRVTRLTLVRVATQTLVRHFFVGQGFRDGTAGLIESFYQAFSIFSVYARLWELQQDPAIADRYAELERSLS